MSCGRTSPVDKGAAAVEVDGPAVRVALAVDLTAKDVVPVVKDADPVDRLPVAPEVKVAARAVKAANAPVAPSRTVWRYLGRTVFDSGQSR